MLKQIVLCCFASSFAISLSAAAACSKVMKMAVEQWPPYIYTDAKGQPAGLDIELAKAIFAEAGCTLKIEAELPRKRRQDMFMRGEIDLMLAASITPEREVFSHFTTPYRNESISLFTTPDKIAKYRDLDGFAPILQQKITLLAPNAGWYGDDYKKHYFWLNEANLISPFETFTQAIKMTAAHRTELLMGDTGAMIYESKLQKVPIVALPKLVVNDHVRMMLSKKSTTEADRQALDDAILRLEKRGTLKKIRSPYGMALTLVTTPAPSATQQ
jgi:polar amino acid transport system substrate-binding protein